MEEKLVPGDVSWTYMEHLPTDVHQTIVNKYLWGPYSAAYDLSVSVAERAAHADLMVNLDDTIREYTWRKN